MLAGGVIGVPSYHVKMIYVGAVFQLAFTRHMIYDYMSLGIEYLLQVLVHVVLLEVYCRFLLVL